MSLERRSRAAENAEAATTSYSNEHMRDALDVNLPNYASAIVTADDIVDSLSSLS